MKYDVPNSNIALLDDYMNDIDEAVGKNIEKAYKIVLFCKNLFKNNDFSLVKQ